MKSSTLNWIISAAYVSFSTWSGGLVMKVPMKKPLGYPPTNLLTLPTLSLISIPHILPNLALFPFNRIHPPFLFFSVMFLFFHIVLLHLLSSCFLSVLLFSFPLSYLSFCYSHQNKVKQKKQVHFQNLQVQNCMIHYIF